MKQITIPHRQLGKYVKLGEVEELELEFMSVLTDSLLSQLLC